MLIKVSLKLPHIYVDVKCCSEVEFSFNLCMVISIRIWNDRPQAALINPPPNPSLCVRIFLLLQNVTLKKWFSCPAGLWQQLGGSFLWIVSVFMEEGWKGGEQRFEV